MKRLKEVKGMVLKRDYSSIDPSTLLLVLKRMKEKLSSASLAKARLKREITPFNPILDNLKELTGMDTLVLIKKKAAAHSEWAARAEKVGSYVLYYETNPILRELMLKAKDSPGTILVVQNYAVVAKPIFDFSRRNIGLLVMGYDLTPIIDSYKQLGVYILMFVFIGLIFSFFISYMIFKKYVEDPINTLIEHTERISMGDVDQKVPVDSKDEIGKLAEAFERMRISIKKVMDLLK